MLLTIYLALIFCLAITVLLISAVIFIQKKEFFSSAPKEAQALIKERKEELFYGARTIGWTLLFMCVIVILGVGVLSIWDGFRNNYSFSQFFLRFFLILTIYKLYDMIFFDWFFLCKFHFFQHFYPEAASSVEGRRYGFNLKSQLLKLLVIFPMASALVAFICTLF